MFNAREALEDNNFGVRCVLFGCQAQIGPRLALLILHEADFEM